MKHVFILYCFLIGMNCLCQEDRNFIPKNIAAKNKVKTIKTKDLILCYNQNGNLIRRITDNGKGERTESHYDKTGLITSDSTFDYKSKMIATTTYDYDSSGRLLGVTTIDLDYEYEMIYLYKGDTVYCNYTNGKDTIVTRREINVLNKNGKVFETYQLFENKYFLLYTYVYNEANELTALKSYQRDGTVDLNIRFDYDERNLLIKKQMLESFGDGLPQIFTYEYY